MRDIHRAPTEADAVKVIDWWQSCPTPQHQTQLDPARAAASRKLGYFYA